MSFLSLCPSTFCSWVPSSLFHLDPYLSLQSNCNWSYPLAFNQRGPPLQTSASILDFSRAAATHTSSSVWFEAHFSSSSANCYRETFFRVLTQQRLPEGWGPAATYGCGGDGQVLRTQPMYTCHRFGTCALMLLWHTHITMASKDSTILLCERNQKPYFQYSPWSCYSLRANTIPNKNPNSPSPRNSLYLRTFDLSDAFDGRLF